MSELLTSADFAPHVGSTFTIHLPGDADHAPLDYSITLTGIEDLGSPLLPGERAPFSLFFNHPQRDAYLTQATYQLRHTAMGILDIFLVPLGPDATGMRYQAVFS
jgi:hypothetical protein